MPNPSERFEWLAQLFDALVERLNQSASLEERTQLLDRMKILIDKLDGVVFSAEGLNEQDTSDPQPPDQPTAES